MAVTQRDPWLKCERWPLPCAAAIYTHHLPPSPLLASTFFWPMTSGLDGGQQQLRLRIWKQAVAFAATKGPFLLPRRNCGIRSEEFTGFWRENVARCRLRNNYTQAISTKLSGCFLRETFFFKVHRYKKALKTNKYNVFTPSCLQNDPYPHRYTGNH